ncbi:hypothetical protein NMU03_01975 [Allocoprobacillus halotolerans]|nr:DUF6809 family protein [Allocoprobacillus halotolerans]UTY39623.1 hypothetical protein NMU03_01975 [Allocoprobacillus halotolerans]
MNDFIKDLYFGRFIPSEKEMPYTKEYQTALKHNEDTINQVLQIMKEKQIQNSEKLIDEVINSWIDVDNFVILNAFEDGIKLGLELGRLVKQKNLVQIWCKKRDSI